MTAKSAGTSAFTDANRAGVDEFVTALLTASRALVAVSVRSLVELNDTITLPQFRTLVVLHSRRGMSLNALAEILGVNPSSAMRMVDRLLAAGLVTRAENPENRRQVALDVTAEGSATVRRVTALRRREIRRVVEQMPGRHRAALIQALHAFALAAEESDAKSGDAELAALGW